jgi:SMODS domain-containing protein
VTAPTIAERFDIFLGSLEPDDVRAKKAEQIPTLIREELMRSPRLRLDARGPQTLLVGSYKRHTAINEIKDVDIAVIVAPDYSNSPPAVVMKDLKEALDASRGRRRLGQLDQRSQRRSIRCELPEDNFVVDVVPVVAPAGDPHGALLIPDREWRSWVETRSIGYVKRFSDLNASSGRRLVPLVKLMKAWRAAQRIERVEAKPFWIEALVVALVEEGKIAIADPWAEVMRSTFDALYQRCLPLKNRGSGTPTVRDPMLPTHNVAHNWTRNGFLRFFKKLEVSRRAAEEAVSAQDTTAARYWRGIFGAEFAPSRWDWILPAAEATTAGAIGTAILLVAIDLFRESRR